MAADQERRTEAASLRQIREARRKGQVARSRDLGVCATLAAALLVFWAGSEFWVAQLQALVRFGLTRAATSARTEPLDISSMFVFWLGAVASLSLSVLLACALAAILVNGAYNGWLFAPAGALPQFDRLSPAANLQRMFSTRNTVELLKSSIKVLLLAVVLWLIVESILPWLIRLPLLPHIALPSLTHYVLSGFLALMLLGMCVIAAFDGWYQRVNYSRELRMTREERQRERREDEGDPALKAKRRQLLRALAQESPLERCAYATLVLCDSSQAMATAIYWDVDAQAAPWMLHKGRHATGLAIIQMARDHGLAIIEDADLCTRIYQHTGIDADLSAPHAAELQRLYRLARRSTRPRSSSLKYW